MANVYKEYAFVADLYDHVTLYRDRSDVGFLVEAATAAGSPVLEIGCGTGRVLIATARGGIDIVGLDFEAEHLLARAGFTLEHVYADYDRNPYGSTYPGELLMVARRSRASRG